MIGITYGVKFGDYHSLTDWNLYLMRGWGISPPPENRYKIKVPGADGYTDLTKSLTGRVTYDNREGYFPLKGRAPRETWDALYHAIINAINGETLQIVLDSDPDYYYTGFVTVGELKAVGWDTFQIEITADLEPFKWEETVAVYSFTYPTIEGFSTEIFPDSNSNLNYYGDSLLYFGNSSTPTLDLSGYDYITVNFTKTSNSAYSYIRIYTTSGEYPYQVLELGAGEKVATIQISDLVDYGVNPAEIYFIRIVDGYNGQIYAIAASEAATELEVEGAVRTTALDFVVTGGVKSVTLGSVTKELPENENIITDLVLSVGTNKLVFQGDGTEGGGAVSFRRGWL